MRKTTNSYRLYELTAGTMYLLCMVTSIAGGLLIEQTFNTGDILQAVSDHYGTLLLAAVFDVINAAGVIGIAVSFYCILKTKKPAMSAGYICLRSMEAAFCLVVAMIPVVSVSLVKNGGNLSGNQEEWLRMLLFVRTEFWAYLYPIVFIAGAALFYSMLYMTKTVPAYIAIWGLLALAGVAAAVFMPAVKMIPGAGIIANELYLGGYLLIKGVRTDEPAGA
ncbi:MAG TPA: DUF4386 domain-containing protein [Lachnospiraceae bacterium]|nr:DUF4386 domain-containing protein [Lachnospiraceae bacterium]